MDTEPNEFEIKALVESWSDRTLRRNDEYQRGLVWKVVQKQRFVDSVFRGYPLPVLFLREKTKKSLSGRKEETYEIVDGLQRIEAMSGFIGGKYPTLKREDSKLALPESIMQHPCEWGGKFFNDLPPEFQARFAARKVTAILIKQVETEDEVRDLFIRLQAGTALTRQQVRDAWPGPVGPFVAHLAGTAEIRPTVEVFNLVDKRGRRKSEEANDEDPYHEARQTCTQLLAVFFMRLKSPGEMPSLKPSVLDDVYHANLHFDTAGPTAERFRNILAYCEAVLQLSVGTKAPKVKKNDFFSLFNLFFDLTGNEKIRMSQDVIEDIAVAFWNDRLSTDPPAGRVTSSTTLWQHYQWFLTERLRDVLIPTLDKKRIFSEGQKQEIWKNSADAKGTVKCATCKLPLDRDAAEFDHKIPWISGGTTTVGNGQVVHAAGSCHRRGIRAREASPRWNVDSDPDDESPQIDASTFLSRLQKELNRD